MTRLVLSTSNIMGGGSSVVRRPIIKSNLEFTSSLRANFASAQSAATARSQLNGANLARPPFRAWTAEDGYQVSIPALDFSKSGLSEEPSSYEITVKLFFLPNKPASCRCAQTRDAVKLVLQELHTPSIDLLIVSFPGISFDAEDEDDPDAETHTEGTPESDDLVESGGAVAEDVDTMIKTWACLEELHDEGVIKRLGVSEFGSERLARFLHQSRIRPSVNQINVRDCCVVPKPLILFAKQEKVELLTHNDCTNILPQGTTRELLGSGPDGAGVLADDNDNPDGLRGDVEPQWVIKYTAVVKNRGVIENKGYFALAELNNE